MSTSKSKSTAATVAAMGGIMRGLGRLAAPAVTIDRMWDENQTVTEHANGRIYYSTRGRWIWMLSVGGVWESTHYLKREALARKAAIEAGQ